MKLELTPVDAIPIAAEGATDAVFGRPRWANPYCRDNAPDHWLVWDLGWAFGSSYMETRGAEEAARWLTEAA